MKKIMMERIIKMIDNKSPVEVKDERWDSVKYYLIEKYKGHRHYGKYTLTTIDLLSDSVYNMICGLSDLQFVEFYTLVVRRHAVEL